MDRFNVIDTGLLELITQGQPNLTIGCQYPFSGENNLVRYQ